MGGLTDAIVEALTEFVEVLFSPITALIQRHVADLVRVIVETPHPNAVFEAPTNGAWSDIYTYYWDAIVPLSLMLWALSIGLVIFLESTSYLFSNYHRSKLKKRAVTGLLGVLAWWWLAAISLRFVSALTGFLVPDLSEVSLFQTLSFSALGVLGLAITLMADLTLFLMLGLIYYVRQIVLYMFVLLMPILIVLWIPGVGPFALVSRFMRRMAGFYVPFLFMTVPVAILFRLGQLLGGSLDLSMGGLGAWLAALVIPFVAVAAPIVLFWQAGALFFAADRASHRISKGRGKQRVARTKAKGEQAARSGQNFARGVRGNDPIGRDGQTNANPTESRAHSMGSRVQSSSTRLSESFGLEHSETHSDATTTGDSSSGQQSDSDPLPLDGRTDGIDPLRDRVQSRDRDGGSGQRSNADRTPTDADDTNRQNE